MNNSREVRCNGFSFVSFENMTPKDRAVAILELNNTQHFITNRRKFEKTRVSEGRKEDITVHW